MAPASTTPICVVRPCLNRDWVSGNVVVSKQQPVASVIAVDQNNACVRFIEATTEALDMPIQAIRAAVLPFLERHISPYGFVFADPPYEFTLDAYQQLITVVFSRNLLEKDGLLIVEHAEQMNLSDLPYFTESRNYGGCVFSFFGW